jgi:hypothetical protein
MAWIVGLFLVGALFPAIGISMAVLCIPFLLGYHSTPDLGRVRITEAQIRALPSGHSLADFGRALAVVAILAAGTLAALVPLYFFGGYL